MFIICNDVIVCDIYEFGDEIIEQFIQILNNIILLLIYDNLKVILPTFIFLQGLEGEAFFETVDFNIFLFNFNKN